MVPALAPLSPYRRGRGAVRRHLASARRRAWLLEPVRPARTGSPSSPSRSRRSAAASSDHGLDMPNGDRRPGGDHARGAVLLRDPAAAQRRQPHLGTTVDQLIAGTRAGYDRVVAAARRRRRGAAQLQLGLQRIYELDLLDVGDRPLPTEISPRGVRAAVRDGTSAAPDRRRNQHLDAVDQRTVQAQPGRRRPGAVVPCGQRPRDRARHPDRHGERVRNGPRCRSACLRQATFADADLMASFRRRYRSITLCSAAI